MTIIYIIVTICITYLLFVTFSINWILRLPKEKGDRIISNIPLALFILMLCVIFRL